MIHTNRTVTVGNQESIIDSPIILYRGDREIEVEFTLNGNKFTFTNSGNVIKSTNATHGQLVINTPTGENMFSEVIKCHEGKVVFLITKEMIDELVEIGFYSFQIRLFDDKQVSRVTIPPVFQGIDIRNPIAAEDETNAVDVGLVDYAVVQKDEYENLATFLPDGSYNKTDWESKELITEAKLDKIEDALYTINENMEASDLSIFNRIETINQNVNRQITEFTNEADAEFEAFETSVNTNIEQFKTDTNAVMTTHKNEVSEELESVNEELESVNSHLATIENQIYNRSYKPQFVVSTYWNEVRDTNGNYMMYDETKVLNDLNNWVHHRVDGITVIIHIGVNVANNKLFIGANLETLMGYVSLAIEKGLNIHAVKIHKQQIDQTRIDSMSDFNTQYKTLIDTIADKFKGLTNRFICFNEFNYMYNNQDNKDFVINAIEDIKAKGYKVGVSTQGSEEMYVMDEDIKESLDILGINHYRYISTKKDKTTYSDSFNSWNNSTVLKTMKHLKEKYPNKEVVMTESGVQDYWEALAKPEYFEWGDVSLTGGKAQATYLYGLLTNTNVDYIDSVWWWYNFSTIDGETAKITRCMLKGENK